MLKKVSDCSSGVGKYDGRNFYKLKFDPSIKYLLPCRYADLITLVLTQAWMGE